MADNDNGDNVLPDAIAAAADAADSAAARNNNDNDNRNNDNDGNNVADAVARAAVAAGARVAVVAIRNRNPNWNRNNNNNNNNNANNNNRNNNAQRGVGVGSSNTGRQSLRDLHEAILTNSPAMVELYLREGADPNRSPQLTPFSVTSSNQNRTRDIHGKLGRVFRSRQEGTIHPLHVAVCNAYHNHSVVFRRNALRIIQALLDAGANPKSSCAGMTFCGIGTHPNVTITSRKTATKLALFFKGFPLPACEELCCTMMDEVVEMILSKEAAQLDKNALEAEEAITVSKVVRKTWARMMEAPDDTFADICFVCPDGQVRAHRCVLAAAVPYFAAVFQGPWKEKNDKNWTTSVSSNVMKAVFQYIYTGEVDKNMLENDKESLLAVASEYQIDSLMRVCERKFMEQITVATMKSSLGVAHLYELSDLKAACFKFVFENSIQALTDPSIMSLASENEDLWKELVAAVRGKKRPRDSA